MAINSNANLKKPFQPYSENPTGMEIARERAKAVRQEVNRRLRGINQISNALALLDFHNIHLAYDQKDAAVAACNKLIDGIKIEGTLF